MPWQAEAAPDPRLLVLNEPLAAELGLDPAWLRSPDGRAAAGRRPPCPSGATPVAQAYAGHQFGGYAPRLGDGRALLLGELVDADGRLRDLHLKGSGRTPFARGGDGLAAVGPMLREYVVSEAMHALGIPTTRSLAVVATGPPGAPRDRRCRAPCSPGWRAATCGSAASSTPRPPATSTCCAASPTTRSRRHYPGAAEAEHPYLALFEAVVAAQASLVARWMLVGFVHGVMNTDNMTISGETIDYGPCAFMDAFDPATVYSSIDHARPLRLRQPAGRGASGTSPGSPRRCCRCSPTTQEQAVALRRGVTRRVPSRSTTPPGRPACGPSSACRPRRRRDAADRRAARAAAAEPRRLHVVLPPPRPAARGDAEPARGLFLDLAAFDDWLTRWRALGPDADAMDRVNPVYIPRNHLVEEALAAATDGDLAPLEQLLDAVAALRRAARPRALRRAGAAGLRRLPHLLRHLSRPAQCGEGVAGQAVAVAAAIAPPWPAALPSSGSAC